MQRPIEIISQFKMQNVYTNKQKYSTIRMRKIRYQKSKTFQSFKSRLRLWLKSIK